MGLIILSGSPCSGKTTYLKNFSSYKIVSSDEEILLLGENTFTKNELNIIGVKNSLSKIKQYIESGESNIVYDSTNLTISRRKDILKDLNLDIEVVSFVSDFNNIYKNWEKRGKDIKIEMLLYLFMLFETPNKSEGYDSIKNIKNIEKNDFKYLENFLNGKDFNKEKILEENKDIKVLNEFWKKGGKDFFSEYKMKLEFLEDMILEDKLALFYSDIKYFYIDFIDNLNLTYQIDNNEFLKGFINNILLHKIHGLGLDKEKVLKSFYKTVEIF